MDLSRYTETLLLNEKYIPARKINFFDDMNGNLIAGNTAMRFDPILAYFTPAGMNFKNQYEGMLSSRVIKEGARINTDEEVVLVKTDLHQLAKEVDFRSGLKSSVGHVIFPGGLGLINGMNLTNIGSTLTTIAAGFSLNSGLYPGKAAIVTNMKITYTSDRNIFIEDKGIIGTGKVTLDTLETVFNEAFSDAVCDLSKFFRQEPGVAASFWHQPLLLPTVHHIYDHYLGTLALGENKLIKVREFQEKTSVMIHSLTLHSTISATILAHNGDPVVDKMSVTGLDSLTKKAWTIGGETGTILMLKNESPGPVDYGLDIID